MPTRILSTSLLILILIPFLFALEPSKSQSVNAGLSPLEAIQAGTRNCAESVGKLKDLGTVEKHKIADFVLLDKNPLTDITNTKSIIMVVVNGHAYTREDLDRMLQRVAQQASSR
jgi:adenine deaminase